MDWEVQAESNRGREENKNIDDGFDVEFDGLSRDGDGRTVAGGART